MNYPKLSHMTPNEREKRIKQLWRSVVNFSLASAIFVNQMYGIKTKIAFFGQQLVTKQDHLFKEKHAWYIIMPTTTFKSVWNILLILALLYTATFLPYQVAFLDEDTSLMKLVNNLLDAFFWCDICISFISAYELPNGNYEPRSSKIVKNYLRGWFWIDLISTFPTEVFGSLFITEEDGSANNVNKLARLARIPRLYRLTRILRTLRILKVVRYHSKFSKWFTKINLSQQGAQILKLACLAWFLIHVTACLWYYLAKL